MDVHTILIIIGLLLPVLIRFAKRAHFDPAVNGLIAVAVYLVVGVVSPFVAGQPITADNLVIDIGIVLTAGTAGYTAFWKNLEDPSTTVATPLRLNLTGNGPATPPTP